MSEPQQHPKHTEPEVPANTAATANDNVGTQVPGVTPNAAPAAPQAPKKGFLQKTFNFVVKAGAGAIVSAALQTGTVSALGLAGAPVWATLLIAGGVVGIGSTLVHDGFARRDLRKQGVELAPYFSKAHGKQLVSKENRKVFCISAVAAIVGSALYLGFQDGLIQHGWNTLTGHAAKTVVPPVQQVAPVPAPAPHVSAAPVVHQPIVTTPVAPVKPVVTAPVLAVPPVHHAAAPVVVAPVHCLSPVQQFNNLIKGHHVTAAVHNALHRASLTNNAHVHAQGVKDLGYYAQNGLGGVPKNDNVALQLFTQAAHEGNKQAMRGMLYLQHYGLDGITANKTASLAAMKSIPHDTLATHFVKAWSVAGKSVPAAKFNADAIVKGVKFACPS